MYFSNNLQKGIQANLYCICVGVVFMRALGCFHTCWSRFHKICYICYIFNWCGSLSHCHCVKQTKTKPFEKLVSSQNIDSEGVATDFSCVRISLLYL